MDAPKTPKQDCSLKCPDTSERSHYFEAYDRCHDDKTLKQIAEEHGICVCTDTVFFIELL
ncbi:hypothetical protein BU25DRAFT_410939 [Macroventuria anomochaeta]|uniref:Uncharacterized protein n=1 Tax=Macroventuria anomochaeta TaxID=301207 RepID=A0ACB6S041_9PLEO|nr:uncharacterized protein BU25DRAFT_410939 [Macroventuria anomochaeta]KAF2627332.1 hypothetical protein BU25DRAFT_410939 [Macroventuria anomochaeta]